MVAAGCNHELWGIQTLGKSKLSRSGFLNDWTIYCAPRASASKQAFALVTTGL
jgi:hypothetical protein